MVDLFPEMYDKPDGSMVGGGFGYIAAVFGILPFFMLLFAIDLLESEVVLAWVEIAYHVLGFVVCILVYRGYLSDCLRPIREKGGHFFAVTGVCLLLSLLLMLFYFFLFTFTGSAFSSYARFYALPMAENNFLTYPMDIVLDTQIAGLLCVTVLTPVTISCLYYGSGFAPVCYERPWLAYLAVAGLLFIPRLINCMTYRWIVEMELLVYAVQLPLHFIACYAYQKTDSIWAPILILAALNLFSGVANILFFL